MNAKALVDHFFRREYGKLVALLSRRIGVQHIELVEDAVQSALINALESWTAQGLPANPSAWVFKVARNNLISDLRQRNGREQLLEKNSEQLVHSLDVDPQYFLSNEPQDDLLRMLFISCDDVIPIESQLAFSLKVLCGFNVKEIALRLFSSEESIYKRISRAKKRLQNNVLYQKELSEHEYTARVPAVNKVLYLLFTEGYLSSQIEESIRHELCEEAIRLASIFVNSKHGQSPTSYALLALMHFHFARKSARQDASGGLLLFEEQDRSQWDQCEIQKGLFYLEKSAQGDVFSRYHAEAGIAAEHCLAPSFEQTNWQHIVCCYELLEKDAPSALHRLNRAVALAQWRGAQVGLDLLENFTPPSWLEGSYLWSVVLADLYRRVGNKQSARIFREQALTLAPTPAVRQLIKKRLKD